MKDGKLFLEVSPYCIADNVPLYGIEDVFNGIMVDTDAAGTVMFYGRGAGKLPTASAVVSDIIDIAARKNAKSQFDMWKDGKEIIATDERKLSYLLRIGGDCEKFKSEYTPEAFIVDEGLISVVTEKLSVSEYEAYVSKLEQNGYTVISSYKVFE